MHPVSSRSTPATRSLTSVVLLALLFVAAGFAVERLDPFPRMREAIQQPAADFPSTTALPEEEIARGLPLIAIGIDPAHLYDPETGLLTHLQARGRAWERPARMSYYDEGRLVFASGVGLRLHGGASRLFSKHKSYRFYFRRQYGAAQFRPGVLFGGRVDPIRSLVLHNDVRMDANGRPWHFVNPLAYDITTAAGALAAETKIARVFVNGELHGVYVITERLRDNMTPELLVPRFGHADFAADYNSWRELARQVSELQPIRMDGVAAHIDIDNLTRWFISVLFCATEDNFQGPQLKDLSDPDGRWFFINWDMDHSFMDFNQQADVPWEHDTFRIVLERAGEARRGWRDSEVRSIVLTTMLAEDAEYQAYFKRTFDEVMNHRLTREFLDERFAYYARMAQPFDVQGREYLETLQAFLTHRPAVLREQAEQYLNTRPSRSVTVRPGGPGRVLVDGHPIRAGFDGRYFPDARVRVEIAGAYHDAFDHWRVDGQPRRAGGPAIEVVADHDLLIEPVFETTE